jgi:hypothetical protein
VIEASSIPGLRPTGVETLPEALIQAGLIDRLGARHAGRTAPHSPYDFERIPWSVARCSIVQRPVRADTLLTDSARSKRATRQDLGILPIDNQASSCVNRSQSLRRVVSDAVAGRASHPRPRAAHGSGRRPATIVELPPARRMCGGPTSGGGRRSSDRHLQVARADRVMNGKAARSPMTPGNLIFATAFATSLLGTRALADGLGVWDWVAVAILFLVGMLIAFMLWPYYNYTFRFDPEELLSQFVDASPPASMPEIYRALALRIKADMVSNWRIIQPIRLALQLSLVLLLAEILAWLLSIGGL